MGGTYESAAFFYHGPGDVRRDMLRMTCGVDEMIVKVILCARAAQLRFCNAQSLAVP